MQEDVNDSKTFDVQYSIRLPEDLATEINTRAAAEGVKPSTWIRNCITSAIRQKNELNADVILTPLLMLLKEDKSVRALIKDIVNEKLPDEERLRKRCEDLTTSISGMEVRRKERNNQLKELGDKCQMYDDRIKQLSSEIGALKQVSHGTENNAGIKGMIADRLNDMEEMKVERRRIGDYMLTLKRSVEEEFTLYSKMIIEQSQAMEELEALTGKTESPQSGKRKQ